MFRESRKHAFYSQPIATALATNLYTPHAYEQPPLGATSNDLDDSALQTRIVLSSHALSDTLSMLDDRILLTLGVRHQGIQTQTFAYNTGAPAPLVDKSRISPLAGVVVKLRPDTSLYAN